MQICKTQIKISTKKDTTDMADKRDENQDEPKIKIVDRRILSDDERAGNAPGGSAPAAEETERPKLEIIGGGAPKTEEPAQAAAPEAGDGEAFQVGEEDELSEAERDQMREEIEAE